jgi:hypothetical protein
MARHKKTRRNGAQRRRAAAAAATVPVSCRAADGAFRPPPDFCYGGGAGPLVDGAVEDLDHGVNGLTSGLVCPPSDRPLASAVSPPPGYVPAGDPVSSDVNDLFDELDFSDNQVSGDFLADFICPDWDQLLPAVDVTAPQAAAVTPPSEVAVAASIAAVDVAATPVVLPPPVVAPVATDEIDDVILVSDCPFSPEFVADVVRAVPTWSASYIFGELCRRAPMSLGARRLLLAMVQTAVASDRRTAADFAAAASIAIAADPSGLMAVQVLSGMLDAAVRRPQ